MKNLIIVLSVFLTVNTVVFAQKTTKKEEQKAIYICPTHPEETNLSSGKCLKCGMDLIKITEKIDNHALKGSQPISKTVTKYVCSMDSTISDKPGQCSKCGMDMVKITEKVDTHTLKGSQPKSKVVTKYVCTMDGSTSDEPGKCPKCSMEMTPKLDHKH